MKVSLDDGVTWQEAETVRVMYEQVDAPLRGEHPHDLFFTFTHEGLITERTLMAILVSVCGPILETAGTTIRELRHLP